MTIYARRTRHRGGALLAVAVAVALGLLAAGAAAVPPGGAEPSHNGAKVTLGSTKAGPGGRIRASGTRFPASKSVSVKLDDDRVGVIGVLKVNASGRFSGVLTIPSNVARVLKPGRHWLRFLAPASSKNHQSNTSVKTFFTLTR